MQTTELETPLTPRAVVDLGAIDHNVRLLREHAGSAQVMAVVKADGYGHGAVEVGKVSSCRHHPRVDVERPRAVAADLVPVNACCPADHAPAGAPPAGENSLDSHRLNRRLTAHRALIELRRRPIGKTYDCRVGCGNGIGSEVSAVQRC